MACNSLRSVQVWVPGDMDPTDIGAREYEGKEVYDLHGARFERATWTHLATQAINRQLNEQGHGVIVEV